MEKATHLEATPLVYDGIMYVSDSNQVHALDARTGRRIWLYHDEQAKRSDVNRGAAMLGDSVFFVTSDAHLVALHRKTGAVLWDKEYANGKQGNFATLAPLAVKDRIVVGVSGGDSGKRGFVAAYAAATGEELWRFYTIPAKGEPGSETWGEVDVEWGGGATWLSGTFDPELNLLYWTTGNPWPDFYGGERKGDNLYSASLVALDADTGKLKWYFQFTPHDTHDWDAQAWPVLMDMPLSGTRAQTGGACQSQRLLLRARSHHRRVPARHTVRRAQLGQGHRRQRPADCDARYRSDARRQARVSQRARRIQLDVALLQSGDGPVLRADARGLRRLQQLDEKRRADEGLRRRPAPRHPATGNFICVRSIRRPARSAGNIP